MIGLSLRWIYEPKQQGKEMSSQEEVVGQEILSNDTLIRRERLAYLTILMAMFCTAATLFLSRLRFLAVLTFIGCPLIIAGYEGIPTLILTFPLMMAAYTGSLYLIRNNSLSTKLT